MSETTRDDGGMTGRFLVVNRATGQVVTDVDTWAEAVEIRDGCEEDSPNHAYLIAEAATPPTPGTTGNAPERLDSPDAGAGCGNDPVTALPTPDLDAVLEALVYALETSVTLDKLESVLRLKGRRWALEDMAEAMLAAAQREAAWRIWCGSCHKLVRNQLDDIHSCFDADAVYRERIAELEADVARLTKPTQPAFQCPKCAGYFFGSAQKDGVWEYHCHGKMGRDGRQEGCGWRGPERECFPDAAREAAP